MNTSFIIKTIYPPLHLTPIHFKAEKGPVHLAHFSKLGTAEETKSCLQFC